MTRAVRLSILLGAFFAAIVAGTITLAATPSHPAPDADATPWSAGPYAYDGSGNIYSIGTDQYRYDPYGRLVTSNVSGTKQSFTYDRYGNIVSVATTPQGGSQTTLSLQPVASNNRLPANGTDVNASYDASGRTLSVRHMTGVLNATFTYDALDSVVSSSEPTPRIHLYTANDERIATLGIAGTGTAGSDWTLRDASGKVLRRMKRSANGTWTWVEDYVYLNGQLVASDVATPERTLHHHPDHLGSPRLITSHMGARVALHTYYAFGREITDTNQDAEPLKYTGHERDSPELDYMHARYYLPGWGRFLSVDPVLDLKRSIREPQSWNRYSYVVNNPINRIDPDGRVDQNWDGGAARQLFPNDRAAQREFDKRVAKGTAVGAGVSLGVVGVIACGPSCWKAAAVAAWNWARRNPQAVQQGIQVAGDLVSPAGTSPVTVNPTSLVRTQPLTLGRKAFSRLLADIKANGIKETIKYVEVDGAKYVVDGHHRLEAARQLGMKVPVEQVSLPYKGYKTADDLNFSQY